MPRHEGRAFWSYWERSDKQQIKKALVIAGGSLLVLCVCLVLLGGILAFFLIPKNPYRLTRNDEWSRGLMVDLGSSGSRITFYQWTRKENASIAIPVQPSPLGKYEYWEHDARPGLASFADDIDGAADSIRELLDFAMEKLESVDVSFI